jgi:hypothetical protein
MLYLFTKKTVSITISVDNSLESSVTPDKPA